MKEFKYVVQDELGLHARPAGLLVKEAAKYKSAITLDSGAKKADAKRIMAAEAQTTIQKFFQENL